jgi:hypothetical protein
MHELCLYGLLGLPTWTLVDGTWAVLSQLADTLPEGYNISAYLILSLTIGNLVPLVLGLTVHDSRSLIKRIIYAILFTGLLAGVLLSAFWDNSVMVSGGKTSLPLFLLFFVVGACASSSNVTHYTYVSLSAAHNTTALATGMGLGSMTAGVVALLQGFVLKDHGFSVTIFYLTLALLYFPAVLSFASLNRYNKYQNVNQEDLERSSSSINSAASAVRSLDSVLLVAASEKDSDDGIEYTQSSFLRKHAPLLALQMINASLGYGFVPALVSFACGKFEHRFLVLQLATGIAAVIDPLSKFMTYYVRLETVQSLQVATACLVMLATGLILCATLPSGLTLYKGSGGALPVLLYVSFMALFGFTNTCIFRYFKCTINGHFVHHAYRWSGICSQAGALLGSLLAFAVIVTGAL